MSANFGLLQRKAGVSSGRPCLRGSGICVEFLAQRFAAGESIALLAMDYGRRQEDIEAAIRLVVVARGSNLDEKRAAAKVAACLPLIR